MSVRQLLLDCAERGLCVPICTDLALHEKADAAAIRLDGPRLGEVAAEAARRWDAPFAIPLMDLTLEKADLLNLLGMPDVDTGSFHFHNVPDRLPQTAGIPFLPAHEASLQALEYIARQTTLVPFGMVIGPFSLMTKLLSDPITPIALMAAGMAAADDQGILNVERALRQAECAVLRSVREQVRRGARAVLVCEPAANAVYLSPRQLMRDPSLLDRFVLEPNLRLRAALEEGGAELVFHDCGELTPDMVQAFAQKLRPSMLSLGSSRTLWEDAALVPKDVVLYGNLPTKTFYSDAAMPDAEVESRIRQLIARMREAGHPHILGSECDVLHVPEAIEPIRRKVGIMRETAALEYAAQCR